MDRRLAAVLTVLALTVVACAVAVTRGDSSATTRPAPTDLPSSALPTLSGSPVPTEPPTDATPTIAVPPTDPPLVLAFAGDTSFTHGLHERAPLAAVAHLLSAPSLAFVNLETAVAEEGVGSPEPKEFTFRSPPESVDTLLAAGIDGVALANNHALDYGVPALARTMEVLDAAGLPHAGAGADEAAAYAPRIFEAVGRTVALLSFSHVLPDPSWAATSDRAGLASAYEPFVDRTASAIADARRSADVVVVMVHWGREYERCPQPYQRQLAAAWAAAGADVVMGSHPHVLMGIERIGETWVAYSTGNFAFPSARGEGADSGIVSVTLDGDEVSLSFAPLRSDRGVIAEISRAEQRRVRDLVGSYSFGWRFDRHGNAVPAAQPGACGQ